jgi:hypothetical protein
LVAGADGMNKFCLAEGQGVEGQKPWQSRLKYQESRVISMCEVLERRTIKQDLSYDLEEPGDEREITRGLMRLSQQALSKYVDKEPDIY